MSNMLVSDGNNLLGYFESFGVSSSDYTWEMWFRPDKLPKTTTEEIVIIGMRGTDLCPSLGLIGNASGTANFQIWYDNSPHILKDVNLSQEGEWYHLALVHQSTGNGNGEFSLYLFGRKYHLFNTTSNHHLLSGYNLDLGGFWEDSTTTSLVMKGAIDEIAIWNKAVSEQKLKDGMSQRISPAQAKTLNGLLAYINFDSLAGNGRFTDETGNSNEFFSDLIAGQNIASLPSTDNKQEDKFDDNVVVGGPKHALTFPGNKDCYVSIPGSKSLSDFDQLTVEAWVKPDDTLPDGSTLSDGYYTILHQENAFFLGLSVKSDWRDPSKKSATFVYKVHIKGVAAPVLVDTGQPVSFGNWQYVAIFGGQIGTRTYSNAIFGKLQLATPGNLENVDDILDPNAHDLTIGASQNPQGGTYKPFNGSITEVRIWKKDLGTLIGSSGYCVLSSNTPYRYNELPYTQQLTDKDYNALTTPTPEQAIQTLYSQHQDLVAYYKFDHGEPGQDNTNVNWLRDHSRYLNHGQLKALLKADGTINWSPNWVEVNIDQFNIATTHGNSNVIPEPGILLELPKLYSAETRPQQPEQRTNQDFGQGQWEDIAGLYVLVKVKPKDVLVVTLNGRSLSNTEDRAGVALGIAIDGKLDNRSGIYYERGGPPPRDMEEVGGMSIQYVYEVPELSQGVAPATGDQYKLLAVRGKFAAYGGGEAIIEERRSVAGNDTTVYAKSTLHVMAYSRRQDPNA